MNPLKQGLKRTGCNSEYATLIFVKVVNPLKQGLKQNNFMIYYVFIFVKVVNPLKQGLKHMEEDFVPTWVGNC